MEHQATTTFDFRKLTSHEREVWIRLQLDADASHSKIARAVGIRPTSVSAVIERLVDAGLIVRRPLVDMSILGLASYFVYLRPQTSTVRKRLMSLIEKVEGVDFLHGIEGNYSIFTGFITSPRLGVDPFFDSCGKTNRYEFGARDIGRLEGLSVFGRKYLSKSFTPKPVVLGASADKTVVLNELDIAILCALCESPRTSAEAIARTTRLPASTVKFRLARLSERKVVRGYVYALASIPEGIQCARLLVRLSGSHTAGARLMAFAAAERSCITASKVSGTYDYQLAIEVQAAHDIRRVADALEVAMLPDVAHIETVLVTSTPLPLRFPFTSFEAFQAAIGG